MGGNFQKFRGGWKVVLGQEIPMHNPGLSRGKFLFI